MGPRKLGLKLSRKIWLEHLERRDVPATILDMDLVQQNPENFGHDSVLLSLTNLAAPNYSPNAYSPGLQLVQKYQLLPNLFEAKITGKPLIETLKNLQSSSLVQFVQPNAKITAHAIPNDPSFSKLYGLNNTSQTGGRFDADIDAVEAWDTITGTGQAVVAVIDTGVDYNHQDLKDNIWTNPGEIAGNGLDDDGNGFVDDIHGYDFANNDADPMDDNGHGTHVSGTIGAVGNNGIGVAGVNWHTRIMALKFLDGSGSGYLSNAIRALDYAVANGARLSNNSWGGGGYEATLGQAISKAAGMGHIFVAAAGNSASNNDVTASYPANYAYNNVVAVAATDQNDNLASFSNYGATNVDIAAPGVNIYSTLPGNSYGSYSGTSMATPHVTGALALYWDANPAASYSEVINAVYRGADSLTSLQNRVAGARRLNVGNLFQGGGTTPPPSTDVVGANVTKGQFNQVNGQVASVTLTFSEAIAPASFTVSDLVLQGPFGTLPVNAVTVVSGSGNQQFVVSFDSLVQSGAYTLQVGPGVQDVAGNLMDQNANGVNGEPTDVFSVSWSQQTQTVYSNTTDLNIRDLRTVSSSIKVGSDLVVGDLNVRLNISHTYVSDLVVVLQAPGGSQYALFNRRGGSGDNLANTLFDDQAVFAISQGAAPFTGSFRPESSLSGLNGRNAKGTWTLLISDRQSRDTGRLLDWTLEFTQQTQVASLSGRRMTPSLLQTMVSIASVELPAGDVWSGGALLSTNLPVTPLVQAKLVSDQSFATAQTSPVKTFAPPPRAAMLSLLDRVVWSRLVEDSLSPRAKVSPFQRA
jgi:subtilisin family serine protease/subtilisin-like proprotein convertase family protein